MTRHDSEPAGFTLLASGAHPRQPAIGRVCTSHEHETGSQADALDKRRPQLQHKIDVSRQPASGGVVGKNTERNNMKRPPGPLDTPFG